MSWRLNHFRKLTLHALRHKHHHLKIKHLIRGSFEIRKSYWPLVLGTLVVIGSVLTWNHQSDFSSVFNRENLRPAAPTLYTQGYQQGILIAQRLSESDPSPPLKESVATSPSLESLANSLVATSHFSEQGRGIELKSGLLQRSLVATFYLGEGSDLVEGALKNDTQLLNEIENVLSLDLFQYLNQSVNRADSLQSYLNLLSILEGRGRTRQNELLNTLAFLENQIIAQEQILIRRESNFFNQLNQFQGGPAQGEFEAFVSLQQEQAGARARAGAYRSLRDYYAYYQPLLQIRIEAIQANREALIAGVRVINIPGVDLGLIQDGRRR